MAFRSGLSSRVGIESLNLHFCVDVVSGVLLELFFNPASTGCNLIGCYDP